MTHTQTLAHDISLACEKLATLATVGFSATLFCGFAYGLTQACYYWPILTA